MSEIKLRLTVDETNLILEALGQQPFAKVFALIGNIQTQAGGQIESNGGGSEPEPDVEEQPDHG